MNNLMRGMEMGQSSPGHAHEHSAHEHPAHEHSAHEHSAHTHSGAVAEAGPSSADNLLLDIGADTGALVIHAAAHRDEAEIEISPSGGGRHRTHNVVRRREAVGGARYAAVFPALPAGDYIIWRDAGTPAGTVTVRGGAVASFRLDHD